MPISIAGIMAAWLLLVGPTATQVSSIASWLPRSTPENSTAKLDDPEENLLREIHGSIRPLICGYRGDSLQTTHPISSGHLKDGGVEWTCCLQKSRVTGDGFDLSATFKLELGIAASSGVAMAFDFAKWSSKNYVLVPGVVYNGNRFDALGGNYMPAFPASMFFNPKSPLTISNDPRLSVQSGMAGKIELLTGNASTPAMGFFSPAEKRGFILLGEQGSRFGNNGMFVEENVGQNGASFVVSAPGVRKFAAGFGGFSDSGDIAADWKPGDTLTLKFRIFAFPAKGIPDFLERFSSVRKSLTGPNHPRQLVPMSEMAETILPRFKDRWTTVPAGSFYLPENNRNFQLGWVSGFMQTPLLASGDPKEREHICRQIDFVVEKLQGSSGFFFGGITADGELEADRPLPGHILALTRKNGDTLLTFFKYFQILRKEGHGDLIKPGWERSARRLAEAFVKVWKRSHEFGQYVDPASGEVAVYNSTGGAIVPAGLALASDYFHEPRFRRVAEESAEFYYQRDIVGRGLTGGACGDITQDPDSESAFGFLESTMGLYRVTGDPKWIDRARIAADLASTWVLSYDEVFPANSQIGALQAHMAGAVFASAQNKHAAPGICTSSGDTLFKLYRATGDIRFADLIRDIQHAGVEATEMPGHLTCGAGYGASMERIQPTDAEGKDAIGNFIHTQNAWTELDNLMMATELPGIYLQRDRDLAYVFDHVRLDAVIREQGRLSVTIYNPTAYDVNVAIFVESSMEAKIPLDSIAYLGWPKVEVKAGKSRQVEVMTDGSIR